MTSLLFSVNDLAINAHSYSCAKAFLEDYPLENLFGGSRHAYARLAAVTSTDTSIICDLGPAGTPVLYDHFILGGVGVLRSEALTAARLLAATAVGGPFNAHLGTASAFGTRTFAGPDGQDVLFTSTVNSDVGPQTGTWRFWNVTLQGTNSTFTLSKFHAGNWIDLDVEPDNYEIATVEPSSDGWLFPRGQRAMARTAPERHRITVEYDGLTDAQATTLRTRLLADPYRYSVYLYAAQFPEVLFGNTLLHCRVLEEECEIRRNPRLNWNFVRLTFEEQR